MEILLSLFFFSEKKKKKLLTLKSGDCTQVSRLLTSLENLACWPAFQHGWSGGEAAPSGKACAAQCLAWPPSPCIHFSCLLGHEFVRTALDC